MLKENQFLATVPFDLYELSLFQLVARHHSFTKAAEVAGLTQSAVTRQMQGIENSLGLALFERTTRTVRLTGAGIFLLGEASRLLGDVGRSLEHLAHEFAGARRIVHVGVSRTIGLSYLPAFFHANLRRSPAVGYRVICQPSSEIISALETGDQDVGVLCPPRRLPRTLKVTHKFRDAFTLIVPIEMWPELNNVSQTRSRHDWLKKQNWLLIDADCNTGQQLRSWMVREGWRVDPVMELDNFDLIINLVALGMGISFVPTRSLALYNQRRKIQRVPLSRRFQRELVILTRKHRRTPTHIEQFVANILY